MEQQLLVPGRVGTPGQHEVAPIGGRQVDIHQLHGGELLQAGFGANLGGGLAFADPKNGLSLDMKARGLVAHEASGFREWGASTAFSFDPRPSTDRGLSMSLRQSWGASPAGGMDALLGRVTLADLATDDNGNVGGPARGRNRLPPPARG